jgi:hypothetical protein
MNVWLADHVLCLRLSCACVHVAQGKRLVFVTNNSTKSRAGYLGKFTGLGLNVNAVSSSSSSSSSQSVQQQQRQLDGFWQQCSGEIAAGGNSAGGAGRNQLAS